MASVELRGVHKRYAGGAAAALHDLSLEIAAGELMVFVGPSGCGKSTLLRLLAGLEQVSGGDILIDGVVVNDLPPQRRNVAMVFQNYALYPHMTVRQNIAFPLRMMRLGREDARQRLVRVAELLGLEGLLEQHPGRLSGGQRQRVAMARALVRDPAVFLMDEPLSNLDAQLRVQIRTEIQTLQRHTGTTTAYVTHDQVEAMTLGQRVAVLNGGVLQQVGPPRMLYEAPANTFVAGFLGSPSMNLFATRVVAVEGAVALEFGDQRLALDAAALRRWPALRGAAGRTLTAGLRPEAIGCGPSERRQVIAVRVAGVENLGHEQLVFFPLPGGPVADAADGRPLLAARCPPDAPLRRGAAATLTVDMAGLHLFDAAGDALPRD